MPVATLIIIIKEFSKAYYLAAKAQKKNPTTEKQDSQVQNSNVFKNYKIQKRTD